jgi:uncharacterized protein (DUF1697 family)
VATYVALLRGINLAGRRRVAMPRLREVLIAAGYDDVRTFLQSGNVVLTSRDGPDRLERDLQRLVADELGVDSPVIVRTRDELADVVARNPLGAVATDPRWLQVTFLSAQPSAEAVRMLAEADVAPEQLVLSGREIYTWHPHGIQRSKAAQLAVTPRLGVAATSRNWSTVTKLLALADG